MLDGMFAEEAAEVAKKLGYNEDSIGCQLIQNALRAAYENGKAFQKSVQLTLRSAQKVDSNGRFSKALY